MTVGLIGGLVVYAAPDSVLTAMAFTNVQSMIHHGLQILTGIVTAMHYRKRITSAFCLRGIALFSVMFAIANLLNTVGFNLLVLSGAMPADANFNMFYISPNPNLPFPMLDGLFSLFHPAVYITGYYVAIVIGIILICYATVLIDRLVSGRRSDEVDK